jgi:hypothetical protein
MRTLLYAAATLALATTISPDAVRSALAAAASALFEATPFVFAGAIFSSLFRRCDGLVPYLGCGCGCGPGARSVPAAAATWLLFGPAIAVARFLAALAAARIFRAPIVHANAPPEPLRELAGILPAAILAGAAMQIGAVFDLARLSPAAAAAVGAALGFAAAPCGLGAVALGGALRIHAPWAAGAFLCIAGIADVRAFSHGRQTRADDDAFGYVLLAVALAIVASRHGDALVHPLFTIALGCCACAALLFAFLRRRVSCASARLGPALMLAGALVGAPPPEYRATETTLTDLFPGEQLTFSGALAREGTASAIVRYAITCCRADAAPIAVRLDRTPLYPAGTWLRVDGQIEVAASGVRLMARRIERIAAPSDPFVYR